MKKIFMTAALAIAAFAGVNAATATATNTMRVIVPQVLSVTAVPSAQNLYLSSADLNGGTKEFASPTVWTIKSNATYNVFASCAVTLTPLNSPLQAEQDLSVAAFKNAMQVNLLSDPASGAPSAGFYSLAQIEAANMNPLTQNNMPHTDADGHTFTVNAKVVGAGMNMVPGTYVTTITVTATQP